MQPNEPLPRTVTPRRGDAASASLRVRSQSIAIALGLLAAVRADAQDSSEVLLALASAHAQQLEEYNAVFLQEQTYFASRHRVVKVDADALLSETDISFTPFDDVEPIDLIPTRLARQWDGYVAWRGRYADDRLFELSGGEFGLSVTFSMHPWHVDESGTAVNYDPDNNGFFSVFAVLDVPDRPKYVLQPLRYTPQYSVVYEIPRDAVIPFTIDRQPGEPDRTTDEERAVAARYRAFIESLPDETDKKVVGDVF